MDSTVSHLFNNTMDHVPIIIIITITCKNLNLTRQSQLTDQSSQGSNLTGVT